jgi:hypothetical protein
VTPNPAEREHQLAAAGHAYLAYLPAALAVCTVVVVLALAGELRYVLRNPGRRPARPPALGCAILPPAIFAFQEHFERLLHDGVVPWDACLQPTFAIGLLLALPFAVAAYSLARLLLRAVRSLGRLFVPLPSRRPAALPTARPASCFFAPRVPVLALGYGSRGPPPTLVV